MTTPLAHSVARLKRLIPRLRGKRVGVLGDLMLDRYLWGTSSRISPEAPVPVVDFVDQNECLGGAGNVAANLAALGAKVEAFGVLGSDEAGRALKKCLHELSIGNKGVLAEARRITTVKTRIIARHQQIVRVDYERRDGLRSETQEKLLRLVFDALKRLDGLVISDYDKGLITDDFAERVLSAAHQLKVPVFVGLKRRPHGYRGAFLVTCNVDEASSLTNQPLTDEQSLSEAGHALLARFGCMAVVITRSDKGMSVFDESSARPVHLPATGFDASYARAGQPGIERGATGRQVLDRTGAGDTVLSVLALAAAAGASMVDAAMLANIAAGVVVGKLGTASVSPKELESALNEVRD